MRESVRQVSATRVALLELRDEERLVEEGYELLDEKRMLLAAEIRRELSRYRQLREDTDTHAGAMRSAFLTALDRHGFDELECLPSMRCPDLAISVEPRAFLGIELVRATVATGQCETSSQPAIGSLEAQNLAVAHIAGLPRLAALAAAELSLRRLTAEYVRTERRARALENVLLPEIRDTVHLVEEQLESLDQEEALRARRRKVVR